jgi:phage terminase large subunit-like protein
MADDRKEKWDDPETAQIVCPEDPKWAEKITRLYPASAQFENQTVILVKAEAQAAE